MWSIKYIISILVQRQNRRKKSKTFKKIRGNVNIRENSQNEINPMTFSRHKQNLQQCHNVGRVKNHLQELSFVPSTLSVRQVVLWSTRNQESHHADWLPGPLVKPCYTWEHHSEHSEQRCTQNNVPNLDLQDNSTTHH